LKLTFLGTGTSHGVPIINCHCKVCQSSNSKDKRQRTSVHLSTNEISLLIDTSPDLRKQALDHNITNLDAILYTHEHSDHTNGIDELRPFSKSQKEPLKLFLLPRVMDELEKRYTYIFSPKPYPGMPKFEITLLNPFDKFTIGGIHIQCLPITHGDLDILAYKIEEVVYITDASKISSEVVNAIKNCKVLVLNALRHEPHFTHFSLSQALEQIENIQPQHCYLIHMSHEIGLHDEVNKELPPHVELAYDGLQIEV
jgi:phosphoribosyl 1,2-cyclic phosphate phosphodiesterase